MTWGGFATQNVTVEELRAIQPAQTRRPRLSVILRAPDGYWTAIGRDDARGIVPEQLTLEVSEQGPESMSFRLSRDATASWLDLAAFTEADIVIGGTTIWSGRIWQTPATDRNALTVSGRGWHHHLDDDRVDLFWVHRSLGDYRDLSSFAGVPIGGGGGTFAGISPSGGSGAWTFGVPNGTVFAAFQKVGVMLDLGPNRRAARVVVDWEHRNNASAWNLCVRGHAGEDPGAGDVIVQQGLTGGATGTTAATLATPRRYVSAFLEAPSTGGTTADEIWAQVSSIRVFEDAAYEASNQSVLRASRVVADVLASGALPLLSQDASLIEQSALFDAGVRGIPELAPGGYQTARELIAAANAYHDNLWGVDADRRLFFRARPAQPSLVVGAWGGWEFNDQSLGSGEDLYNRVIVQATGPDGAPLQVIRTIVSPLLARQGFTRTGVLSAQAQMTQAAAEVIGDAWLAERARTRMSGTLTAQSGAVRRLVGGEALSAYELLGLVGERILIGTLVDPDTGELGRVGRIVSASWNADNDTVSVSIDSVLHRLDVVLARYGALAAVART